MRLGGRISRSGQPLPLPLPRGFVTVTMGTAGREAKAKAKSGHHLHHQGRTDNKSRSLAANLCKLPKATTSKPPANHDGRPSISPLDDCWDTSSTPRYLILLDSLRRISPTSPTPPRDCCQTPGGHLRLLRHRPALVVAAALRLSSIGSGVRAALLSGQAQRSRGLCPRQQVQDSRHEETRGAANRGSSVGPTKNQRKDERR